MNAPVIAVAGIGGVGVAAGAGLAFALAHCAALAPHRVAQPPVLVSVGAERPRPLTDPTPMTPGARTTDGLRQPELGMIAAATGALFAAFTATLGLVPELPAFLFLALAAMALLVLSSHGAGSPDSIVLPSYIGGLLLLLPAGAATLDTTAAARALIAAGALWAIYLALRYAYPDDMAFAEVKLAGLLGLFLGWLGWEHLFVGALGSLLLVAVGGGLVLLVRHRAVSLAPFLITAAMLSVVVTVPLATWYQSLLSSPLT